MPIERLACDTADNHASDYRGNFSIHCTFHGCPPSCSDERWKIMFTWWIVALRGGGVKGKEPIKRGPISDRSLNFGLFTPSIISISSSSPTEYPPLEELPDEWWPLPPPDLLMSRIIYKTMVGTPRIPNAIFKPVEPSNSYIWGPIRIAAMINNNKAIIKFASCHSFARNLRWYARVINYPYQNLQQK